MFYSPIFMHLFICLQIIVLKPCNRRSKRLQCTLSLLLTMPKPIVLIANFQVTNVGNDLLVFNVSWVYSLSFSRQSIEKPGTERKSKRKLFTYAEFPRSTFVLFSAFKMDTKLLVSVYINLQ